MAGPHTRPRQAGRRGFSWRTPVAALLITLGCILAPLSVLGVWTANQISDTSRYVANVAPLIKDPAIAPFHFRIDEQGPKRLLIPYEGASTSINGTPVSQHWLRNGDQIQAGGTTLQYLERAVS